MISSVHYLELYINGELMELKSQDSLNLRINNVIFNPTEVKTAQGEYSFSFELPSTPHNDKVLNYANNLSRLNKFHTRYKSQVYADGELIFDGSLTIQKYDAKDKLYTCNLVNIKINTLEEIFGDDTLTKLKWMVPFNGAPTINEVNDDFITTKYYFPFVSYGVFQKNYVTKDEVGATYTSKFVLDKYAKYWVETFYPSLNMLEIIKKAYQSRDYNVTGSAFSDPYLKNIYCSTNLASEQIPDYNYGNPRFGKVSINTHWSNGTDKDHRVYGFVQDLNFPYYPLAFPGSQVSSRPKPFNTDYCDLTQVEIYNILDKKNTYASSQLTQPSYLWDKGESCIVAPADGFYRINMTIAAHTLEGDGGLRADTYRWDAFGNEVQSGIPANAQAINLLENAQFELQLVRNYKYDEDNLELIFGKRKPILWANSMDDPYCTEVLTCFPHENCFDITPPTKENDLVTRASRSSTANTSSGGGTFGHNNNTSSTSTRAGSRGNFGGYRPDGTTPPSENPQITKFHGYVNPDRSIMAYDPVVSDNFICGISTFSSGVTAVRKNGYSWSKHYATNTDAAYNANPYIAIYEVGNVSGTDLVESATTDFNSNQYLYAPQTEATVYSNSMRGNVSCLIWLNRNDIIEPMMILRKYTKNSNQANGQTNYYIDADIHFEMEAISNMGFTALKGRDDFSYNMPSLFPYDLNLFNFTNKETKIADWIKNVQEAFNLEIIEDGNNIEINTNQGYKKDITYAVDIDDRVSEYEAESEYISYPREMSVKYKIDTDEWGFERTVPAEHINDEDDEWKKWGDSGFTIIKLNDDSYETKTQNTQTQFSYTYYDDFLWKDVLEDGTERDWSGTTITIPVIEKAEYMADGYGYEEAMKHDGYSFTQRFWYRDQPSQEYVWLADSMREKVYLVYPMNQWDDFNLSYKDTEKSLLTEFFNVSPMLASNFVTLDVYLNPEEYKAIKGGAKIRYDKDLYVISEIQGYDPSGNNLTTLKLIKQV